MLMQIRSDESVGTPVSLARKTEALSHLMTHFGARLDAPLALDLESVRNDGKGLVGSCDATSASPSKIPSFARWVLITVNTDAAPDPLVATALVFFYLGNERITFPHRDYVWCSFEAVETNGEVESPKWHFHGWQPDVYEEYLDW